MKRIFSLFASVVLLVLGLLASVGASCTPAPSPGPPVPVFTLDDGGWSCPAPATPECLACANLDRIGCDEGHKPSCAASIAHAQASGLTDLKPKCLADATDKEAARRCGTVECP